jgi:intracellular sulfur oxidation DsrE/DsrF family protein
MSKSATLKVKIGVILLIAFASLAVAGVQIWRSSLPAHAANVPSVTQDFGHQKIIYHIAESGDDRVARMAGWLGSMQNHFAAVKPGQLDMAIVMNGDGIDLLIKAKTDHDLQSRIDSLKKQGARFLVCRNTLVARGLDPATDLYDVKTGDIVAAGVAEIAMLEGQGYGYLRP